MTKMLKQALDTVQMCITYAELNGLTNTQEFIEWEDELAKLSCKDHTDLSFIREDLIPNEINIEDWLNYKKNGVVILK